MIKNVSLTMKILARLPSGIVFFFGGAMTLAASLSGCGSGGNGGGSGGAPSLAKPSLSDSGTRILAIGQSSVVSFTNTGGGSLASCAIQPSLPAGLSIVLSSNNTTCEITGAPTAVGEQTGYSVTATNASGSDSATVILSIITLAPLLVDVDAQSLNTGQSVSLSFTNNGGGSLTACTIEPALPTGLSIDRSSDNSTCEITGTALVESARSSYTITANYENGTNTATIIIAIALTSPALADIDAQPIFIGQNVSIPFTNSGGGSLASCAIQPTLAAGLNIEISADGSTCEIVGSPSEIKVQTDYEVIATNAAGGGGATFSVSIIRTAPSLAEIEAQTLNFGESVTISIPNNGGGELTDCTMEPTIPAGLEIAVSADGTSCEIAGVPTTTSDRVMYTVTASNTTGADNVGIAITVVAIPSAVFLPNRIDIANTTAQLTWSSQANAIGYEVWRALVGDGELISRLQTGVTMNAYQDDTLMEDTDYYYLIAECTTLGCVDPSNTGPLANASFSDDLLDGAVSMTIATVDGRNYALVAAREDDGVEIIDITDPTLPVAVSRLRDNSALELDAPRSITTTTIDGKSYALVAAAADNGMQIIDISDPATPTPVASLTDTANITLGGAFGITTTTIGVGTYALVAAMEEDGVQIIDISDPTNPSPVASLVDDETTTLDGPRDITTIDSGDSTYALVAATLDHSVQIIDIGNPNEPIAVASVTDNATTTLGNAYYISTTTIDDTDYALVTSFSENGIQIININDPTSPTLTRFIADGAQTTLRNPAGVATTTIGDRTYALIASFMDDAMQIIEITDPTTPVAIASLSDSDPAVNALDGAFDIATHTVGDKTYALVAAFQDDGFQIIDISVPATPMSVASLTDTTSIPLNNPTGITTTTIGDSTYALVATSVVNGVQLIDITDPTSPGIAGSVIDTEDTVLSTAYSVATATIDSDTYALVSAQSDDGIQIINISDPNNPMPVASLTDTVQSEQQIELDGARGIATTSDGDKTYALVAAHTDNGVQIIEITDPDNPAPVASLSDNAQTKLNGANGIAITTIGAKTYAVVAASGSHGIQIIEITDPTNPNALGSLTDDERTDLVLNGARNVATTSIGTETYAVVTARLESGIQIINISDPNNPVPAGSLTDNADRVLSRVDGVTITNLGAKTYALVAANLDDGVQIIDITDPTDPTPVASIIDSVDTLLDGARDITSVTIGDKTYALVTAQNDEGVQIIDITTPQRVVAASSAR